MIATLKEIPCSCKQNRSWGTKNRNFNLLDHLFLTERVLFYKNIVDIDKICR
jgi:hypothetical protein